MDLGTLDPGNTDGEVLQLRHPASRAPLTTEADGKGEPITLTLVGMDHPVYRRAQSELTNKRLAARSKDPLTAEQLEADALDVLVRCVRAWKNITLDGQVLDCTPANVRKVFERLRWVREQVDEFIGDRANFLTHSAKA